MRERHGKPSPPVIIIPLARLSCSRSLIPPPGGGGLYKDRRRGRARKRGAGERERDAPSFPLLALSILDGILIRSPAHRLVSRLVPTSRLASRPPLPACCLSRNHYLVSSFVSPCSSPPRHDHQERHGTARRTERAAGTFLSRLCWVCGDANSYIQTGGYPLISWVSKGKQPTQKRFRR